MLLRGLVAANQLWLPMNVADAKYSYRQLVKPQYVVDVSNKFFSDFRYRNQ